MTAQLESMASRRVSICSPIFSPWRGRRAQASARAPAAALAASRQAVHRRWRKTSELRRRATCFASRAQRAANPRERVRCDDASLARGLSFRARRDQRDAVAAVIFDASGEFQFDERGANVARRRRPRRARDRRSKPARGRAALRCAAAGLRVGVEGTSRADASSPFVGRAPRRRFRIDVEQRRSPHAVRSASRRLPRSARTGSRARMGSTTASTSSTRAQRLAPWRSRSLVPSARGSSGEPGAAKTSRFCSAAKRAVISEPGAARRLDDHRRRATGRKRGGCGGENRGRAAPIRSAFPRRSRRIRRCAAISATASGG